MTYPYCLTFQDYLDSLYQKQEPIPLYNEAVTAWQSHIVLQPRNLDLHQTCFDLVSDSTFVADGCEDPATDSHVVEHRALQLAWLGLQELLRKFDHLISLGLDWHQKLAQAGFNHFSVNGSDISCQTNPSDTELGLLEKVNYLLNRFKNAVGIAR